MTTCTSLIRYWTVAERAALPAIVAKQVRYQDRKGKRRKAKGKVQ